MEPSEQNYRTLEAFALEHGIALFGVARYDPVEARSRLSAREQDGLSFAISMGVRLSAQVLSGIGDCPTLLYQWHYRQANMLLDRVAFRMAGMIQEMGGRALPVAASQIVDWEAQTGHLSHRHIGAMAGHGWLGRNNLLVHPRFGAAVRYVTVLTDLPLTVDRPVEADCGTCRACVSACPVGAIGETAQEHNFQRCFAQLQEYRKKVGQYICGICVRACQGTG
jgi:ferredoxin